MDFLKRKDKILIDAIDILDKYGTHGLTTREIAKREGISEPAVYRQYTGKKDIIMNILDKYAEFDNYISDTIDKNGMSFKEGINFYVKSYAEYYENYPQICTVMFSYDLYKYEENTRDKMQKILSNRSEYLISYCDLAKKNEEISKDIETEDLVDLLQSVIWWYVFKWKTFDYQFTLKEKLLEVVNRTFKDIYS
ncbi:MAG: TetR/AcrR family transcriptional regulator [Eubacteriales bacterium]